MNRTVGLCLFFLFIVEIFSVRPRSQMATPAEETTLRGAIHVHSTFSDGGGTPDEIAEGARRAGLDFVVLTDHNNSQARKGFERRYNTLDLFVEMEASTPGGHALSFFSHTEDRTLSDPRVVDQTYEHFIGQPSPKDLFIVVAHPSNVKNPWTQLDRYPEGIEIANFDSFWQRQASESLLDFCTTVLTFPLNNYLGALRFLQFYEKDLSSWDSMNMIVPGHFGILGHDTHSKFKLTQTAVFRWPDYEQTFRMASNVVFLKEKPDADFEKRRRQIYSALRSGSMAVTFQILGPFDGNDWTLTCGHKTFRSGDQADLSPNCHFQAVAPVHFPYPVRFKLIHDGKVVHDSSSEESVRRIPVSGPGVYRLEVYAKVRSLFHLLLSHDVPYVFYNPIYVR
ncbi:MAG: hypothetical protein HYR96_12890 [Deltaproteobacteria bacterium]|nr:hypothetical protein [Deltaproteobacteria bacterium]MBI3294336.1 hypothetical protein [Deltaproteobacteria bacterium]